MGTRRDFVSSMKITSMGGSVIYRHGSCPRSRWLAVYGWPPLGRRLSRLTERSILTLDGTNWVSTVSYSVRDMRAERRNPDFLSGKLGQIKLSQSDPKPGRKGAEHTKYISNALVVRQCLKTKYFYFVGKPVPIASASDVGP